MKDAAEKETKTGKGVNYVRMFTPEHIDPEPVLKLYKEILKR